jgi:hypothetical protein
MIDLVINAPFDAAITLTRRDCVLGASRQRVAILAAHQSI